MEKLSANIKAAISARPTQTILQSEIYTGDQLLELKKFKPRRKINIPDNFDGRNTWKGLLTPIMNQGKCGSCWAFASTSMLSNRFNIQSVGLMHVELSPAKLILCDWQGKEFSIEHPEDSLYASAELNKQAFENTACYGNTLIDACRYLYQIGAPTEQCVPYTKNLGSRSEFQNIGEFSSIAKLPLCNDTTGPLADMCSDFSIDKKTGVEIGTPQRFFKALDYYGISGTKKNDGSEFFIRDNIYKWGPIATGMKVYPDFYTFDAKNEIYIWNGEGPQVGGHAIELVGWGTDKGTDFWIARNSWGKEWGMDGYFRVKRGVNMCELEDNCIGVIPDFFYPSNYKIRKHESLYAAETSVSIVRSNIATSLGTYAGGIDPETGYTRRVIVQKPWVNLTPPVNINYLPSWSEFIAGVDSSPENRAKYKAKIDKLLGKYNTSYNFIIYFSLILIFCIILYLFKKS